MSDTSIDEEDVHTLIIIPPDGGWGYMVIFCSFICLYLIEGTCYSVGVFLQPIMADFGTHMGQTSFIGAAISCISAMVGPFASACLNNYDARCLCLTACILSAVAYVISALTTHFLILLAANGILLGIGFGMLYIPALIMPNLYFSRQRAIAVAISSCGSGVGSLSLPLIASALIQRIGWRNTYFCMTGLTGLAALASLAFIPLKPVQVKSTKDSQSSTLQSRVNLSQKKNKCSKCSRWRNKNFPTAEDVVVEQGDLNQIRADPFDLSDITSPESMASANIINHSKTRFLSAVSMTIHRANSCWFSFLSCLCCECYQTKQRAMYRQDIFYQGSIIPNKRRYNNSAQLAKMRIHRKTIRKLKDDKIKEEKEKKDQEKQELLTKKKKLQEDKAKVNRERLRFQEEIDKAPPDVGDKTKIIKRLQTIEKIKQLRILERKLDQEILDLENTLEALSNPAEQKRTQMMRYSIAVTHVTTGRELYETNKCSCSVATIRALTTLLDFHVLRSCAFILICLNGFFFSLGYYIPWVYMQGRAEEAGIATDKAVMLLTMTGTANTVGRLLSGVISLYSKTNYALMIGICCTIQGIITIFSGFFMDYWVQMAYAVCFGFLAAPIQAVKTLLITELFGIERLSSLFGLQLVGYGIAALLGPPLAGFLRDFTNNFDDSFYFSGSCLTLSGILLLFVHAVRRWEVRKDYVDF